jgi:hypothetical protein
VQKYEEDLSGKTKMTRGEKVRLEKTPGVLNSKGEFKKYINAYDYLLKVQDRPLGLPYYANEALNLFVLGSRGSGKSFWAASCIDHEWLFNGAKKYDERSIKNPDRVEIFMGSALSEKSNKLSIKVLQGLENMDGRYEELPSPLFMHFVGTLESNNAKSVFKQGIKKKVGNKETLVGSKSTISHEIFSQVNLQAG